MECYLSTPIPPLPEGRGFLGVLFMNKDRIVKLELLMQFNKPTINGHIYKKRLFNKAVKRYLKYSDTLPFGTPTDSMGVCSPLGNIISYKGGVFEVQLNDNSKTNDWLRSNHRTKYLLPAVVGKRLDNGVIKDYFLCYFQPATTEDVAAYRELGYKV